MRHTTFIQPATTHWASISLFFLFGVLAAAYVTSEGVFLSGDLGEYLTLSLALADPASFRTSDLFHDPAQLGLTKTVFIQLTRYSISSFGSYLYALQFFAFFNIFFLFLSFYAFSYSLFQSRLTALITTFLLLMPARTAWGTWWGAHVTVLPRLTFLCFWVWVVHFAYKWRNAPGRWPLVMGAQGLLAFIHPVSAFGSALGVWAIFLFFLPRSWPWRRSLGWLVVCGMVFLLTSFPIWRGSLGGGPWPFDYQTWLELRTIRYSWMSFYYGLGRYLYSLCIDFPLIPLSLAAAVWSWRKGGSAAREQLRFALAISAGVLATLVLFFTLHHLSAARGFIPPESQLVRASRFLVFSMLMSIAIYLYHRFAAVNRSAYTRVAVALLIVTCFLGRYGWGRFYSDLGAGARFLFAATEAEPTPFGELCSAAAQTPKGSRFVGSMDLLPLRLAARRPLAYLYKDGPYYLLLKHPDARGWITTSRRLGFVHSSPEPTPDPGMFVQGLTATKVIRDLRANWAGLRCYTDSLLEHGVAATWENIDQLYLCFNQVSRRIRHPDKSKPQQAPPIDPGTAWRTWYSEARRIRADYLVLAYGRDDAVIKGSSVAPVWSNRTYVMYPVEKLD